MLDQLVTGHVLLQESKHRKVAVPDADVDARIGQLRQRFQTEDEFKKALAVAQPDTREDPRRNCESNCRSSR